MKKIQLVGAAPIEGTMRFPSEGLIEVANEAADTLIEGGLAIHDDLDATKVEDLRTIAQTSGVALGPTAQKADLIDGIRKRRANKA